MRLRGDPAPLLPTCDQRILSEVTWKDEPKEDGKSKHKKVPGGVQVDELQVGQADSSDHPCRRNSRLSPNELPKASDRVSMWAQTPGHLALNRLGWGWTVPKGSGPIQQSIVLSP